MPIQAANPFGAFIAGRQARQDEDYATTRNALARMEAEQYPAQQQRRNKLADLQVQGAEQQLGAEQARTAYATLKQALDSGNPKAFIMQNVPLLASKLREQNIDLQSMDDESAVQLVGNLARKYAGDAGVMPAAPAGPMSAQGKIGADVRGGYISQEQGDAALNPGMSQYQKESLDIQRQRLAQGGAKPAGQFRPLTPEEVQQAGLPPGTSAQVGPDGKIDVLSKRDNTGTLSQKDATTAKLKLTTVKLARKQLERIKEAFMEGRSGSGPNAFGPGQGLLPTKAGKLFDARVNQMRSTLTALTRVPGVGAMSDYETKLDQAKFPERNAWEAVTADQIQGIEDMLALIDNGYTGLLSGGQEQGQQQPQASQPPRRVKVDAQGNVIGN